MPGKRKRSRASRPGPDASAAKRQKISPSSRAKDPLVKQAVLATYFPKVCTLREYLVSKLPPRSKIRRKKILSVGHQPKPGCEEEQACLAKFMDKTLIGVLQNADITQTERTQQWAAVSQREETSVSGFADCTGVGTFSQSEVGDCIFSYQY